MNEPRPSGTRDILLNAVTYRGGLRRRLSAILFVAALAPVGLVSVLAAVLVLGSVDARMRSEASRGLEVAQSLLLRQVHDVAARAAVLGDDRELLKAMAAGGQALQTRLTAALQEGGADLIEIANSSGDVILRCAAAGCTDVSGTGPLAQLHSPDRSPSILRALAFERTASIEPTRRWLAVRAAMPLADARLSLVGVVVVSLPLDGPFADRIKAALGSQREVLVYSATDPSASTLISPAGERLVGPPLPPQASAPGAVLPLSVGDETLAVAFGRILDADARIVGMLGVAIDREPLHAARWRAASALGTGILLSLAVAIAFGRMLAARLTRALGDLHAGALAVARGELDAPIAVTGQDELGGLAEAFRTMTRSLSDKQRVLSARMRELQTLHAIGRELSSSVDVDEALERAAAGVLMALDARLGVVVLADLDGGVPRVAIRMLEGAGTVPAAAVTALRRLSPPRQARVVTAAEDDAELGPVLRAAGLAGTAVMAPLDLRNCQAGLVLVLLGPGVTATEASLQLVATMADQIASAVDRVRLWCEVRVFQEQLEAKVGERTAELERANAEAERAARELGAAQAQIMESERAVGTGVLAAEMVQGIAAPAEAAHALSSALGDAVRVLQDRTGALLRLPPDGLDRYLAALATALPSLARAAAPDVVSRRHVQALLAERMEGVEPADEAACLLAPIGKQAEVLLPAIVDACGGDAVLELCAHAAAAVKVARTARRLQRAADWLRQARQALQACLTPAQRCAVSVDPGAALDAAAELLSTDADGAPLLRRAPGVLPEVVAVPGEMDLMWGALLDYVRRITAGNPPEVVTATGDGAVTFTLDCPGVPLDAGARVRLSEAIRSRPWSLREAVDPALLLAGRLAARQGGEIELDGDHQLTRIVARLMVQGGGAT